VSFDGKRLEIINKNMGGTLVYLFV